MNVYVPDLIKWQPFKCVSVCISPCVLCLCSHGDHYKWNKVTSCIYNIMGGQRSVDHYGYMTITNGSKCYCKLTFSKVHKYM